MIGCCTLRSCRVCLSVADCTDAVSTWFTANALLLNPGITEAVIWNASALDEFGHHGWRQRSRKHCAVQRCTQDAACTLSTCTRPLRHIRALITVEAANAVDASIVGSRLNYCNSLLCGTTERNFDRFSGCRTERSGTRYLTSFVVNQCT